MWNFENLRVSVRIREFQGLDKQALARSLWVNRSSEIKVVFYLFYFIHDLQVVQLIAQILIDYKFFDDILLWDNVIL